MVIKTKLINSQEGSKTLVNYTKAKQCFITVFNRNMFGNMINQKYINVSGKVEASKICKVNNYIKNNF